MNSNSINLLDLKFSRIYSTLIVVLMEKLKGLKKSRESSYCSAQYIRCGKAHISTQFSEIIISLISDYLDFDRCCIIPSENFVSYSVASSMFIFNSISDMLNLSDLVHFAFYLLMLMRSITGSRLMSSELE